MDPLNIQVFSHTSTLTATLYVCKCWPHLLIYKLAIVMTFSQQLSVMSKNLHRQIWRYRIFPCSHTCTKVNLCDARKCKSKALLYYLCAPNSEFDCEPRYVNGYVHVWALWIVSCKSRLFHHIRLRLEWLWEFSIIHTLSRFSSISASSCESLPNPNPNFDLNPTE